MTESHLFYFVTNCDSDLKTFVEYYSQFNGNQEGTIKINLI